MYVFVLIYIPYRIISIECPLIRANQEITIIYMFIMLSIICGSLSNNILFTVGDRDYLMMRVMFISPYMSYSWMYAVHPFVIVVFLLAGAGAMYFLWWYKYYRKIVREAMHMKHEN